MRAGDPGCIYNQHAWQEVLGSVEKPEEISALGQNAPVDSFLVGATAGELTTRNVDRIAQEALVSIEALGDPLRRI